MAKANAKDGIIFLHGFFDMHNGFRAHRGVPRPVGDDHGIEIFLEENYPIFNALIAWLPE